MEKLNDNNKKDEKKDEKKDFAKLSEEEQEYKNNIEEMLNGMFDQDIDLKKNAFNLIKKEITTSTGSMTSIPRPLKYLQGSYEKLKEAYNNESNTNQNSEAKYIFGDLLCILVLVVDTEDTSLKFILENDLKNYGDWGQELIRSLSGEITTEYLKRLENDTPIEDLIKLVSNVVTILISTNNESEAIDLLIELDLIDDIKDYANEKNYKKFCSYLIAISNFAAESSEQRKILEITFELYTKYNEFTNALRIAIKLKEKMYIQSTITGCTDKATRLQMAFILARSKILVESSDLDTELHDIMRNLKASEQFKKLVRSLDILTPKHPEEIFKSHLEEKKEGVQLESYKVNMSSSIVNSFVNACFGTEKLLISKDSNEADWLSKNKEEGLICALGGLGLVNLWDIDCGPNELEKFMDVNEMNPFKRGGYNLALGILSSGVNDENNTAYALLSEQTKDKK